MKKYIMPSRPLAGFSLIEVLISILILSVGLTVYAKTSSGLLGSSIDNSERQHAAVKAAELGMAIQAHVANMPNNANKQAIYNQARNFANRMQNDLDGVALTHGYRCTAARIPVALSGSGTSPNTSGSTLYSTFGQGPASCVSFVITPAGGDVAYGAAWVQTTITWLPIKSSDNSSSSITISTLVTPYLLAEK